MKLPVPIEFDWDKGNIDKNWKKHKVHYKEIEEIFLNTPIKIYQDNKHSQIEERFTALGITDQNKRLYVTFAIRANKIKVISARDQDIKERREYEER